MYYLAGFAITLQYKHKDDKTYNSFDMWLRVEIIHVHRTGIKMTFKYGLSETVEAKRKVVSFNAW